MQNNIPTQFQDDRFVVISRLGDGGAASVWRVVDTKYDIERAVKTLHVAETETALGRFEQEVRIMMRLQSPHIVTVFESFTEDGRLHIVMEKCAGSLDTWSKLYGPMPPKLAVQVMIQLLKGLHVAHGKGVVHRDIKPHNVLISEDGTVKLADFGLALLYLSPESLTKTGALLGSLAFMAPEQRINPSEVTPSCDVYSATMTLAWLLEATNVADLYLADTIQGLRERIPSQLVDIIEKGGQHKPEDRYGTAQEMIQALKAIEHTLPDSEHSLMGLQLVEVSIHDLMPSPSQPAVTQNQSMELKALNSVRWMLVVVVLLLLGISGVVVWQLQDRGASNSNGTSVVVEETEEIPMCANPIRSFTRMSKLGPKESVQTAFEDLNQDGKMDALFVNQYSQSLSVYWGNDAYKFEEPIEMDYPRSRSRPIVADFNRDGLLDMVSSHIDLQRIMVHWGQPDNTWSVPSEEQGTELLQIPPPYGGMTYDGNEDGLLDLYLIAQNIADASYQILVRNGDAEQVFTPHQVLITVPTKPVMDSQEPTAYWLEEGALQRKNVLQLSEAPTVLHEGLKDWKVQQAIRNRKGGLELYLFDAEDVLYRWSESEPELCRLTEITLPSRDLNFEESFGYWNDDDIVDILTTRTCVYCTSNHVLLVGN